MKLALTSPLTRGVFAALIAGGMSVGSELAGAQELSIAFDEQRGVLSVIRAGRDAPILTQHARSDFRPYIHPIVAPDGRGVLTQYSPGHHKHQTGLYWGFTRVNGRDYFHHPAGDYWRRKAVKVVQDKGPTVQWRTVYDLLDADGASVLLETQTWKMRATENEIVLDLAWHGTALKQVVIDRYDYGGLFLRMPWKRGIVGAAVSASGRRNQEAEGQRNLWVDVGMQIEGRSDLGHIAIFDHPKNAGFPLPWRVDSQLGVGPVRARLGAWLIKKGTTETIHHQFVVYTGALDADKLNHRWTEFSGLAPTAASEALAAAPPPERQPTAALPLLVRTLAKTDDPGIRKALMRGMLDGLAGRRNVVPPKEWSALRARLAGSDDQEIRDLSRRLSQSFGDKKAAAQAVATVKNTSARIGRRRAALRSLLNQQNQDASDLLESLLDEPEMAIDAIRGYATIENATAPAVLLGRYKRMDATQRRAVIETLATRRRYAHSLLAAVKQKYISRDDIPAHVARSLNNLLGDRFVQVFGRVKPIGEDREKLLAKYKRMVTSESMAQADAGRGRAVFKKTCSACHLLYGEGGKIGPDLTGSNRANLDYILLNSVDPSYDVPETYKMITVATVDGRVLNGVVAEEDEVRVVLKTVEQPRVVIAKEDIEERKVSPKSMMPDGQLEKMKTQELLDLIKYLRTTEQVELAK